MINELTKSRRSIRKFKAVKVETDKVDQILKTVLMAPSSRSKCPWEFVVIDDPGILTKLSACREHGASFLKNAPLAIVVLADREITDVWVEDASIAASYIQLAVHDLGLASCWIQVRNRYADDSLETGEFICRELDIPQKFAVECMIAIGYADEEKAPHDETDLKVFKLHYNGFDKPYQIKA